ncbi:hypothetical protein [Rhizorhapis sp.]|uniref:hypothetical protein n=1 Tax=Rhizorhapis sp. TaxID=1968842 RepID=UPI002B4672B0|nr:hypothetical protein [Rhizorhapis sp.]HKR17631.1 hypothetical protein [Rhizorhapis sp.]
MMNSEGFRVGDFLIEWRDDETVQITNTRYGRYAMMRSLDFEHFLNAMVETAELSVREAMS